MTVLLARNQQLPPTFAAGGPHAELAAELLSLPSGLLAMVCEAIVKLKVRLAAAWACIQAAWSMGEGRRGPGACTAAARVLGTGLAPRAGPTVCVECWWSYSDCSTRLGTLQVSDVVGPRCDSQRTGPLRRSSRLSTLRARGSA